MNFFKKNRVISALSFFILIGLLFVFIGCTSDEDTNQQFELPELGYSYDSLEPYIDAETIEIHYTKHHNNYTNNLNIAFAKHPEIDETLEQLLANPSKIPADIRTAVLNNGGGYYNHALYFSLLKINNGQTPSGDLLLAINQDFGSFDDFKEEFVNAASTQFGSGWAWLIITKNGLKVVSTSNQDTPLQQGIPILCIDVWEHAYYLNYQNRRADYISEFFNIINWDKVAELYEAAK